MGTSTTQAKGEHPITRKNIAYILATIAVAVAVCYYLYTVNALYDGGLIGSLTPYFFTIHSPTNL
ncbi:hypothetical protein RFF05_08310 [Bengtsoniella intestinalis]|uniref:hypothetical protein n=1 Tax=Bengtsoniella intestinalis TaxID=3073143 RepID=UPI00391FA902